MIDWRVADVLEYVRNGSDGVDGTATSTPLWTVFLNITSSIHPKHASCNRLYDAAMLTGC